MWNVYTFTNKLKAKWGDTHKKEKKNMLYNISWEKKLSPWILHWLCISHPEPWGRRGLCSIEQWDGGAKKVNRKLARGACVCVGGGGGWYFKDIQKRQDPVYKHLFRLKSEWAALKRTTELSQAFFFSSIPLSGRAPTSFPSYLMLSWPIGRLANGDRGEGGVGPRPLVSITAQATAELRANPENRAVDRSPQKSSFPKKGTTKSK